MSTCVKTMGGHSCKIRVELCAWKSRCSKVSHVQLGERGSKQYRQQHVVSSWLCIGGIVHKSRHAQTLPFQQQKGVHVQCAVHRLGCDSNTIRSTRHDNRVLIRRVEPKKSAGRGRAFKSVSLSVSCGEHSICRSSA